MIKRIYCLLLMVSVSALVSNSACAEVVGQTADGYIHRYTAVNGQEIYYVSTIEETMVDTNTDVNFDGQADLAVVTALGASNARHVFYLWNGSEYIRAEHVTGDLINYALVDGKYLLSRSNDGNAGMLFHAEVCVWEGSTLKTIRMMVSEEETTITWEGNTRIETLNPDRLHVTLWEMDGAVGGSEILWEKTYEPFPDDPDTLHEMEEHLWGGLRE